MRCRELAASAVRMLDFEAMAQTLRGEDSGCVAREAERLGNGRSEQRVTKCIQHERQRALGDVMSFMPDRELGDEPADRIENRVQRIAVPGEDHPGGERPGTFLAEGIETLVDDHPGVRLT